MIYLEFENVEKNAMLQAVRDIDALSEFMPICEYDASERRFKLKIGAHVVEDVELIMLSIVGEIPSIKEYIND